MGKKQETFAKTTVMLPKQLLRTAQNVTGVGITQTLRLALELLAAKKAFEQMLSLRGTYRSKMNLDELRKDRT